ncbi:MAG TPA: hypothetical protein VN420_01760 [Candidatus Fimivivens sp.]|nr:hypothetical protein [Candidatus Fimivivens sp.]
MSIITSGQAALEKIIEQLGGERALEGIEKGDSKVMVVRHAAWIEKVWKRYSKNLVQLGGYPVYDSEPSSGYGFIRDIHLPFSVSLSEAEAVRFLQDAGIGFRSPEPLRITDSHEMMLLQEVGHPGDRIVSLYDTKALYEERRAYLEWERDHPFSDESFVFWRSHRHCKNSRKDRNDLIEPLRHEDPSQSVSVEELVNFMVRWHSLFLADSILEPRLFPNLGSGNVHCVHFEHSLSFAFRGHEMFLESVGIERGFLTDDNAILLKV